MDNLVSKDHPYRKFIKLLNFDELTKPLKAFENTEIDRHGYSISNGFRILLLQYLEDLSDRELERFLQENLAAKLFCDFNLEAATLDFHMKAKN